MPSFDVEDDEDENNQQQEENPFDDHDDEDESDVYEQFVNFRMNFISGSPVNEEHDFDFISGLDATTAIQKQNEEEEDMLNKLRQLIIRNKDEQNQQLQQQ